MLRFRCEGQFEAWLAQCPLDPAGLTYSVSRSGDGVLSVGCSWKLAPLAPSLEAGSSASQTHLRPANTPEAAKPSPPPTGYSAEAAVGASASQAATSATAAAPASSTPAAAAASSAPAEEDQAAAMRAKLAQMQAFVAAASTGAPPPANLSELLKGGGAVTAGGDAVTAGGSAMAAGGGEVAAAGSAAVAAGGGLVTAGSDVGTAGSGAMAAGGGAATAGSGGAAPSVGGGGGAFGGGGGGAFGGGGGAALAAMLQQRGREQGGAPPTAAEVRALINTFQESGMGGGMGASFPRPPGKAFE